MSSKDEVLWKRRPPRFFAWVAVAVLTAIAGCGETGAKKLTVFPVKGKVLLPDGSPLTSGRIVFVSKGGDNPTGKIGSDGTFTLTSGESGEGAPPGEYSVKIEPDEAHLKAVPKGSRPGAALAFPGKYTDETTSGFKATVKAEPNDLAPFKMDNTPPPNAAASRVQSQVRD